MNNKLFGLNKVIIYTDGGARGNPGLAAMAVIVNGKKYGEYIGKATNNEAEYRAVILGLTKARQMLGKTKAREAEIEVRMDSELIERQLNGEYRVKEENLKGLYVDAHNLCFEFKKVIFTHVPREKNREADRLVNEVLNSQK